MNRSKVDSLLAELRKSYLNGLPTKIIQLRKLIENHERPQVQEEFHKFKGSGKTHGFAEISLLGDAFEKFCKKLPTADLKICNEGADLLEYLHRQYLKEEPADLPSRPEYLSILAKIAETNPK